MSLREEVEEIFAGQVSTDPVWSRLSDSDQIELSGPLDETLQAVVTALNAYAEGLLKTVLHIADAVDDLRGDTKV